MFKEGETKKGFHCMDCGRPLGEREIICKKCFHERKKRGEHFEMTRLPANQRMESL